MTANKIVKTRTRLISSATSLLEHLSPQWPRPERLSKGTLCTKTSAQLNCYNTHFVVQWATTRTSQNVTLCTRIRHNSSVTSNTSLCNVAHHIHRPLHSTSVVTLTPCRSQLPNFFFATTPRENVSMREGDTCAALRRASCVKEASDCGAGTRRLQRGKPLSRTRHVEVCCSLRAWQEKVKNSVSWLRSRLWRVRTKRQGLCACHQGRARAAQHPNFVDSDVHLDWIRVSSNSRQNYAHRTHTHSTQSTHVSLARMDMFFP